MPTDNSVDGWDFTAEITTQSRRSGVTVIVEYEIQDNRTSVTNQQQDPEPGLGTQEYTVRPDIVGSTFNNFENTVTQQVKQASVDAMSGAIGQLTNTPEPVAEQIVENQINELDNNLPTPSTDIERPLEVTLRTPPGGTASETVSKTFSYFDVPVPGGTRSDMLIEDVGGEIPNPKLRFTASKSTSLLRNVLSNTTATVEDGIDGEAFIRTQDVTGEIQCENFVDLQDVEQRAQNLRQEFNRLENNLSDIENVENTLTGVFGISAVSDLLDPDAIQPDGLQQINPQELRSTARNTASPQDFDFPTPGTQEMDIPAICGDLSQADLPDFPDLRDANRTLEEYDTRRAQLLDVLDNLPSGGCPIPDASDVSVEVPDDLDRIPENTISLDTFADRMGVTGTVSMNVPTADVTRSQTADRLNNLVRNFDENIPDNCQDLLGILDQIRSQINKLEQGTLGTEIDCANLTSATRDVNTAIVDLKQDQVSSIEQAIANNSVQQDVALEDIESARQRADEIQTTIDNEVSNQDCVREFNNRLGEARERLSQAESQLSDAGVSGAGDCASRFSDVEDRVSSLEDLIGVDGTIDMAPLTPEDVGSVGELSDEYIRTTTIDQFIIEDAEERISTTRDVIGSRIDDPNCAQNFQGRLDRVRSKFDRIVTRINQPVRCSEEFSKAECDMSFLEDMVGITGTIKVGGFGGTTTNSARESQCPETSEYSTEFAAARTSEEPTNIADMERVLREEGEEFGDVLPEPFRREDFGLRVIMELVENNTIDPGNMNRGVDTEECQQAFMMRLEAVRRRYSRIVDVGTGLDITLCSEEYSDIDQQISDLESGVTAQTQLSDIQAELDSVRSMIDSQVQESSCVQRFNNRLASIENDVTPDGSAPTDGTSNQRGQQRSCEDVSREVRNAVRSYEEGTTTFIQTPQLGNQENLQEETQSRIERGQELIGRVQDNVHPENPCRGELVNDIRRSMQRLRENLGQEGVRVQVEQGQEQTQQRGQRIEEILSNIGEQSGNINVNNVQELQNEEES